LILLSIFGSFASITCNKTSDSTESSRVDENASISLGGNSLMNQIVSFISISFHLQSTVGNHIFQTLVQRVANNLSSANTHFLVSALVSVDFQAFVYQTTQTVLSHFLFLHCLCCSLTFE
jgi:hypothetical protein